MRCRQRQNDNLASQASVQRTLAELKERCPALSAFNDRKLRKLLLAVRHLETYPATDTKRGRPANFDRDLLQDTSRHLKVILKHETGDRISVQTFVGHYLPILDWPEDVVVALDRCDLSRLEAAQVARVTADRLGIKEREAKRIRDEIIANHIRTHSSQTILRERIREALGEMTVITSEKMTEAVERVDDLLKIDPEDRRHLFYEQMKDFFFALRDIQPDEIDDGMLDLLLVRADGLMEVIYSIQRKRRQKEKLDREFKT